ncbi:MAG: TIGR01777 family oxidoreductase [Desulfurivibrionaceae bacterium]
MKALITGGTGFIGQNLVRRQDSPVILGRSPEKIRKLFPEARAYAWQPGEPVTEDAFQEVDTVFHLAGESIFKGRWNQAKKDRILSSRVEGTASIVDSLARMEAPPETLICSSAVGYYGSRGDEILTESSGPGADFLAQVCQAWEKEARKAEKLGIRVVCIRTGVVLGRDGGALPQMLPPFKAGLGGKLGSGRQYMAWIHIYDLIEIMLYAAANKELKGPVNAVSPQPVTNKEFTRMLASVLHRPAILPAPTPFLRLVFGEFSNVLLSSQRALPQKLEEAGYEFKYPEVRQALEAAIKD